MIFILTEMKKLILTFVIMSFALASAAQNANSISGILMDSASAPISFANIVLATRADTVFLRGTLSDENGKFRFDSVSDGDYLLRISAIGQGSRIVSISINGNTDLDTIRIKRKAYNLKGVTVTASRPLYSVDGEKRIYNVEDDAYVRTAPVIDVLQNAPGIEVDAQGNVTLRGREAVEIWINGRRTHMPLESLKQYLKMMPSNKVKSIEVISNPSARYGGGTGVVNIVTKEHFDHKDYFTFGSNGSSRPSLLPWASYVYANNKLCVNTFLSYDYRVSNCTNSDRFEMYTPDGTLSRKEDAMKERNHRLGDLQAYLSVDYSIDTSTTLSAWIEATPLSTEKKKITKLDSVVEFIYTPGAYSHREKIDDNTVSPNGQFQIQFQHDFQDDGHQLQISTSGSYLAGKSVSNRERTYFYYPQMSFNQSEELSFTKQNIGIDMDYSYPFSEKVMLEAGISQNYISDSDKNTWKWFDTLTNMTVVDNLRSYNTHYITRCTEDYLTLLIRHSSLSVKMGIRSSYSLMDGIYKDSTHLDFQKHYFSLIPSAYIAYSINDENSLTFSFTHRYGIPSANQLSTFTVYDLESFSKGNDALDASGIYKAELTWTKYFKQQASLELQTYYYGITNEIGSLTDVLFHDSYGRMVSYTQDVNIGSSYTAGAEAVFTFRSKSSMMARLYANCYHNYYKTLHRSELVEHSMWSYSFRANLMFNLFGKVKLFANAAYRSKTQNLLVEYMPNKVVDVGLTSDFWDNRITAALGIADLFNWNKSTETITNPYYPATTVEKYDSRYIILSLVFRLGEMGLDDKARQAGN